MNIAEYKSSQLSSPIITNDECKNIKHLKLTTALRDLLLIKVTATATKLS